MELGPDAATSKGDDDGIGEHGVRTGDIVVVAEQPAGSARKREVRELEGKGSRGVVTRVGGRAVWVAVDEKEGGEGLEGMRRMWVVKLANDVTYKRYVLSCLVVGIFCQLDVEGLWLEGSFLDSS